MQAGEEIEEQIAQLTRGLVDCIDEGLLGSKLARGRPLRVKLGIDPTASEVHLGFAVVLRALRRFQDQGHVAVLILGTFTAQVGDPSGRDRTRPPLDAQEVESHARSYLDQITKILDPDPARLEIRRNGDWLGAMGMADVLELTGAATVAQMIERDDFSRRYAAGDPITLTEFLYPLLQGRDSVVVEADVELGGTDQLFNLLVGRRLQELAGQEPQVVLTTPLLPGIGGGKKMSKSLDNTVGIDEAPAEQFGKLMSIPDELLPEYLAHVTAWDQPRIEAAIAALDGGPASRASAKRLVGRTVADLYHGAGAGEAAEAEFDRVFKQGEVPSQVDQVLVSPSDLDDSGGIRVARLLAMAGLVSSNREGARKIREGGVRADGEIVVDVATVWTAAELDGRLLQVGKRAWARAIWAR